jgi:uncharacterized protein
MSGYKKETTSIPGNWPLNHYHWKTEQVKLMSRFLDAIRQKRITGIECPRCGLVYAPPKPICRCLDRPERWVDVSDEGVVTTFTFTGAWSLDGKPLEEGESLIVIGWKPDGADTMMVSMLEDAEPDEVEVGMRVRVQWPEEPEGKLSDILHMGPA